MMKDVRHLWSCEGCIVWDSTIGFRVDEIVYFVAGKKDDENGSNDRNGTAYVSSFG